MKRLSLLIALVLSLAGALAAHPRALPTAACFLPDGSLVIGDTSGAVERATITPAAVVARANGRLESGVLAIIASPDGKRIAIVTAQGVHVRDGRTLAKLAVVRTKSRIVALRADSILLTGGLPDRNENVRGLVAWRVGPQGAARVGTVTMPDKTIVALSADGTVVFTTNAKGEGEVGTAWRLDAALRPQRLGRIESRGWGGFGGVFLSADGRRLASLDLPHSPYPEMYPRVYDTRTGKEVCDLDSNSQVNDRIATFDPRATILVTSGAFPDPPSYTLSAFQLETQKPLWDVSSLSDAPDPNGEPAPLKAVHCLSVSVDGKWVAVVTAGGVFVLDAGTGKRVAKVR